MRLMQRPNCVLRKDYMMCENINLGFLRGDCVSKTVLHRPCFHNPPERCDDACVQSDRLSRPSGMGRDKSRATGAVSFFIAITVNTKLCRFLAANFLYLYETMCSQNEPSRFSQVRSFSGRVNISIKSLCSYILGPKKKADHCVW